MPEKQTIPFNFGTWAGNSNTTVTLSWTLNGSDIYDIYGYAYSDSDAIYQNTILISSETSPVMIDTSKKAQLLSNANGVVTSVDFGIRGRNAITLTGYSSLSAIKAYGRPK